MGLIKGTVSLTRYLILEPPPELTDDYIIDCLNRNAFIDIDSTTEEESMGWVDVTNPLSTDFSFQTFNFGQMIILGLRMDTRKVSSKVVSRYFTMALAQAEQISEKPLNATQRKELKEKVRRDLLGRTPVNTDVFEVCWFPKKGELWLAAAGVKIREKLEDLWRRTFGLGLAMKIPFVLARELLPDSVPPDALDLAKPVALYGGGPER